MVLMIGAIVIRVRWGRTTSPQVGFVVRTTGSPVIVERHHQRSGSMSVLCTTVTEVLGSSTYDQMVGQVGPVLRSAPGFVISPDLPPGATPTVLEVHSVMAAQTA